MLATRIESKVIHVTKPYAFFLAKLEDMGTIRNDIDVTKSNTCRKGSNIIIINYNYLRNKQNEINDTDWCFHYRLTMDRADGRVLNKNIFRFKIND